MTKKIILVTGGNGFLGSKIVEELISQGYFVKILTRKAKQNISHQNIEYIIGDLNDYSSLILALEGCYGVIHAAGEKRDVNKMYQVNVEGTKNITKAALTSNIKYFCLLSSVGVIGYNSKKILDETSKCYPLNEYEKTKLEAEVFFKNNFYKTDCNSVIIRPTNVFGYDHIDFNPSFSSKIKRWIKGNEIANYIYVKDVAIACSYFLNTKTFYNNEVFIINQEKEALKFKDIYSIVNKTKTKFYPPIQIPWFLRYIKQGKNNLGNKYYSINKITDTGFKNKYNINKAIEDLLS